MTQNAPRWMMVWTLGIIASLCSAQNVALNKPVTVVAGAASGAAPSTLTDGSFRPRGTGYQDGTVWWNGLATTFEIDLRGVYTLAGLIVQADDNDAYTVLYRRVSDNSWQVAWNVPNLDAFGNGMQTRPDPANDATAFSLPATIETDRLRVVAASGDSAFSLSEVQAIVAPNTQCAAEWRFAQVGARANAAAAFDIERGRAVLFGGFSSDNAVALRDTWVRFPGADAWVSQDVLGPESRSRHAMAYDPARQRVVLFGGLSQQGLILGDTWEWDGSVWLPQTSAVTPPPRSGHAMAFDAARQRIVLFGGQGTTGRLADTWTWDGTTWTQGALSGPNPPARTDAAMAYAAFSERVVLVGGNTGATGNADVWSWNGTTWTQLTTPTGAGWGSRSGHAMAYDGARGRMVLFGGISGSTRLSDIWEWSGGTWASVSASGPEGRSGHAMYFDVPSARVVMYGGAGTRYFGDTWEWSGTAWTSRVEVAPSARSQHAMVEDVANHRLTMFGGLTALGDSNETWEWDGASWTMRNVAGPNARYGHAMAYDVDRRKAVLFGGSVFGGISQDTHEWDGTAWAARTNLPGTLPPRRVGHAMVYDAANHRTVLFGGSGVNLTADTWSFDGTQWSILVPAGTGRPTIRSVPAMAYDAVRGRVIMFGGSGSGTTRLDDTWILEGATWRAVTIPQANRPTARGGAAFAFDSVRGTAVLSGGSSGAANLSDTWEWNGQLEIWSRVQILSPGARQAAAMAYDSTRQRLTLLGGSIGSNRYASDTWVRNSSSLDAPTFTSQPQSLAAASNEPAAFSAEASNALSYRWRRNGVYLTDGASPGGGTFSGTATPTLHLSVVDLADAGSYDVVAINTCGATLSTAATLTVPHGPDLTVTAVQSDPPEGLNGDPVTIRWTVTNTGDRPAPATYADRLSVTPISPPGSETVLTGFIAAPRLLNPGESYTQSFNTTFPNPTGSSATYRYTVRTDVRVPQNLHELREDNNSANSADVPVVVPPPGDLTPLDLSAPTTVLFGSPFQVTWRELNQGGIIRRNWASRVVLSANDILGDADDRVLGTPNSPTSRLPGADSAPFSVGATIPYDGTSVEGTYFLIVKSDFVSNNANGVIAESNEANNVVMRQVRMDFPPRPDLVIADPAVPATIVAGQSFAARWTSRNTDNLAAGAPWQDRVVISLNEILGDADDRTFADLNVSASLPPGEQVAREAASSVALAHDLVVGPRYFFFRTDVNNNVAERREDNNSVGPIAAQLVWPPLPDLQPTDISSSGTYVADSQITVNITVRNRGPVAAAGQWKDRIYLSANGTYEEGVDQALPPDAVIPGPISVDGAYQRSIIGRLPLAAGTYWLIVKCDADRQLIEGPGEGNNILVSAAPIVVTPLPQSDIRISNLTPPANAVPGSQAEVVYNVTNIGLGPVIGPWDEAVYVSSDATIGSDTQVGNTHSTGRLEPGQSIQRHVTFTVPPNAPGNYWLVACADPANAIPETDESNNCAIAPACFNCDAPNLIVTSVAADPSAVAGRAMGLVWTIRNTGTGSVSGSWVDRVYMSSTTNAQDGIVVGEFRTTAVLDRNQDRTSSRTVTIPPETSGDRYFIVITDANNEISEPGFESDNARATDARTHITLPDLPDLIIASVTPGAGSGTFGQDFALSFTGRNIGTTPAVAPWTDRVYLSRDNQFSGDDLPLEPSATAPSAGVAVGATYNAALNLRLPLLAAFGNGTYYFIVVADAAANVGEQRESNQWAASSAISLSRPPLPDLVVTGISTPTGAAPTQEVEVVYTVANNGGQPAQGAWLERVLVSPDDSLGNDYLGTEILNDAPLAVGESRTRIARVRVPNEGLSYRVFVCVDAGAGIVFEGDESNNCGQSPSRATIFRPDITPIQIAAASPEALADGPITILYAASNIGPARTYAGFIDTVSLVSVASGQTYTLGSVVHSNPIETGSADTVTREFIVPGRIEGQFRIRVRTDAADNLLEPNEGNNTAESAGIVSINQPPRPDLTVLAESIVPPSDGLVSGVDEVTYVALNAGPEIARQPWFDQIVARRVDGTGPDVVLGSHRHDTDLEPGMPRIVTQSVTLPADAGSYTVCVIADSGDAVNEGVGPPESNNRSCGTAAFTADGYDVTVVPNVDSALAGTPVTLTGQARLLSNHAALPNTRVWINYAVRGTTRTLRLTTDSDGNFGHDSAHPVLLPLVPTEAGYYTLTAGPPNAVPADPRGYFALHAVRPTPSFAGLRVIPGYKPATGQLELFNAGDLPLTNLQVRIDGAPAGVEILLFLDGQPLGGQSIPGQVVARPTFIISADSTAASTTSNVTLTFTTGQGTVSQTTLPNLRVAPRDARLMRENASRPLEAGMLTSRETDPHQTIVQFRITNDGGQASGPLTVELPSGVPWMSLSTPVQMPSLEPDESAEVVLTLVPTEQTPLVTFTGQLVVRGTNLPVSLPVPYSFTHIETRTGRVQLTATNEESYFAPARPMLAGANVVLKNASSGQIIASKTTDAAGTADFDDVPAGPYYIEATKDRHFPYSNLVDVATSQTSQVDAFLSRKTVSYEWRVDPVQVQDRYRFVLDATFETTVWRPTLRITPQVIDLDDIDSEAQIDVTIENVGLVEAREVRFNFANAPRWAVQPLTNQVGIIPPHSSRTIPVVIRKIGRGGDECQLPSGGVCQTYVCGVPVDSCETCAFRSTLLCPGTDTGYNPGGQSSTAGGSGGAYNNNPSGSPIQRNCIGCQTPSVTLEGLDHVWIQCAPYISDPNERNHCNGSGAYPIVIRARGTPPGGSYSWKFLRGADKATFQAVSLGGAPEGSVVAVTGTAVSECLGDVELEVTYHYQCLEAKSTHRITVLRVNTLRRIACNIERYTGPDRYGYCRFVTYQALDQFCRPAEAGLCMDEHVIVLADVYQFPNQYAGDAALEAGGIKTDQLCVQSSMPLPDNLFVLVDQELYVAGCLLMHNRFTKDETDVTFMDPSTGQTLGSCPLSEHCNPIECH